MKDNSRDLTSDAALAEAITASMAESTSAAQKWYPRLGAHLARVAAATPVDLANRDFLEELWSDESVSATGMGSVKVGPALDDSEFREWFSQAFSAALPTDDAQAEAQLTTLYKELEHRLGEKCGRVARLKLNRVMCSRFPNYLTTLADVGALKFLHRAMGGASSDHAIHAHIAIKRRIDAVLGPVDPKRPNGELERLSLPWYLYEHIAEEQECGAKVSSTVSISPAADGPRPLPASLRRKGLTAIKGYFGTLLEFVQVLQDGLTRDEFADEVRRNNPNLSDNSVSTTISTITREFDLCVRDGAEYRLNARGLNLLETRDPDEFADHLLTKILGVDHVIKALERGPLPLVDLTKTLKQVNPGWNSDFMPRSVIAWLVSLDVVAQDAAHKCFLTERGKVWAGKITWPPESLSLVSAPVTPALETANIAAKIPAFAAITQSLEDINGGQFLFPKDLVRQLHVGLWSHPVRHFAVLTGISGSGKTQLAWNYGVAMCGVENSQTERIRVIPVQPGWFDPTPLFGYVSPLSQQYCSAPFLELLLRAAQDPERPYVVILDEMNLSHPEQYLAPLLSAMETRGWIDLHELPDDVTDVPQRVQYPTNLAIIGTLNMDETTHGLSDKVLDRAFTLEFWNISVDDFPGWTRFELPTGLQTSVRELLGELSKALAPVRLHFGWRTIEDVLRYMQLAIQAGAPELDALDEVIYAKVLPKLRGESTERFHLALASAQSVLLKNDLKRCATKVSALISDLKETGTARFWR
jgi:5-methylcytosine-specific restriction enzyme B